MTVDTIERAKAVVDEFNSTRNKVVTVWEYVHVISQETLYAVFTQACYCDIFESPYVFRPKLIYRSGHFIGDYAYLNE